MFASNSRSLEPPGLIIESLEYASKEGKLNNYDKKEIKYWPKKLLQSKVTSGNESAVFSFTGFLSISRGIQINSEGEF